MSKSLTNSTPPLTTMSVIPDISASGTKVRKRARLAVISGSGPDAGIQLLQEILRVNKKNKAASYASDKDAPEVTLFQAPQIGGPHGSWDLTEWSDEQKVNEQFSNLWENMCELLEELKVLKVDAFCLACNTLHVLEPRILSYLRQTLRVPSPKPQFISIVEAVRDKIISTGKANGLKVIYVGILGTLLTTDLGELPDDNTQEDPSLSAGQSEDGESNFLKQGASPYIRLHATVEGQSVRLVSLPDTTRTALQELIIEVKRGQKPMLELKEAAMKQVFSIFFLSTIVRNLFIFFLLTVTPYTCPVQKNIKNYPPL